jgi:hypothetical protein
MKKKLLFAIAIFCLFAVGSLAQTKNIDIDNLPFVYAYRALPTTPINPIDFNYVSKVIATGVAKNNIAIEEVENALIIEGQVKVENPEEALLSIEMPLGNIIVSNSAVNERKEAADYWNNNKESFISEFYRNLSLNSAAMLSENVSLRYGFKPTDPTLKADVRIRYAAWFNLCKIYYYLDEPESVAQYADKLFENGYDEKDGPKLKKEAEQLLASFQKTGIHTRHFNPDVYFAKEI